MTMSDQQKLAVLWGILNDPANYEYEGLGWGAVDDLRELLGVAEPEGAWLARPMDPNPYLETEA